LFAQELDHLPVGKEALGLVGIGELERLQQQSLGLKSGDHITKITTGAAWIESLGGMR
jgi:hypothetical protein